MTNVCEVVVQSLPYSIASVWVVPIVTTLIGALFGALIGAFLAFHKDRNFRDVERKERQILAAHQLLFALLQQRQDLNNLQAFVGDHEPDQLLLTAPNATLINKQDLAFIARAHPNELNDAVMAEHEYLQAIDALSTFNDYTRVVQSFCRENAEIMDENGVVKVQPTTAFLLDRSHKTEAYKQLTNAIKQGIEQNKAAFATLQGLFKKMFPGEHFWKPQERGES